MKKFLVSLLAVTTIMVLAPLSASAITCADGTLADYLPGGTFNPGGAGCTQQDKIWIVSTYTPTGGDPTAAQVTVNPQSVIGPTADLHSLQFSGGVSTPWVANFSLTGSISIIAPPGNLFLDDVKFAIGTCIFGNAGCTGHVEASKTLTGGAALVLGTNFGPNPGVTNAQAFYPLTQATINWADNFTFSGDPNTMQVLTFTNEFSQVVGGVPEPGTLLLLGSGLAGLGLVRRRIRGR